MKFLFSNLLIIHLFCLLGFVKNASSIFCYDCNSAFDPRCGDQFDPFSLGVVNCSLRDPLEHMPDVEPSVCRTIRMDIKGAIRVVRNCGYLTDAATDDQPCQRRTSSDQLIMTYCSCTTDLCNAAEGSAASGVLLASVVSVLSAMLN